MQIAILRSNRIVALVAAPGENSARAVSVMQELLTALGLENLSCAPFTSVQAALHRYRVSSRPLSCASVDRLTHAVYELLTAPQSVQSEVKALREQNIALSAEVTTLRRELDLYRPHKSETPVGAVPGPGPVDARWCAAFNLTPDQERRLQQVVNGTEDSEASGHGKIGAIKLLRCFNRSLGLREAKDAIEVRFYPNEVR